MDGMLPKIVSIWERAQGQHSWKVIRQKKTTKNRPNTIFAVAGENKDNLSVRKLRHTFFYVTYYIVFYVYFIILYYCHIIFITTTIILTIIVYIIIIRAGQ